MCENKLHKKLTVVIYTDKDNALGTLRKVSRYYNKVLTTDNAINDLLETITVEKPKSINDLCFNESFSLTDNGWCFYDTYGNLLVKDGKYTWICLPDRWVEPKMTTPLRDALLKEGWKCSSCC